MGGSGRRRLRRPARREERKGRRNDGGEDECGGGGGVGGVRLSGGCLSVCLPTRPAMEAPVEGSGRLRSVTLGGAERSAQGAHLGRVWRLSCVRPGLRGAQPPLVGVWVASWWVRGFLGSGFRGWGGAPGGSVGAGLGPGGAGGRRDSVQGHGRYVVVLHHLKDHPVQAKAEGGAKGIGVVGRRRPVQNDRFLH